MNEDVIAEVAGLTPELQERAGQLAAVVLGKVRGHDDQALAQAKYIAFHKANSAGLKLTDETFSEFLELVLSKLIGELNKRAEISGQPPVVRS